MKTIQDRAPYLQANPPKRQIPLDGRLAWEDRKEADTAIQSLLDSVKTVRNNLFHGGKFPEGPVEESARDTRLLTESVAVLKAVLGQPHEPAQTVARFIATTIQSLLPTSSDTRLMLTRTSTRGLLSHEGRTPWTR